MKVMIIEGGDETRYLVRSLCAKGDEVIVIQRDAEESLHLSRESSAIIVHGDGTIPGILDDAGIRSVDHLLALTSRDEDNYVICRIAKQKYGVAAVFALVHDPDNEIIFRELGLEGTFSITATASSLIEQRSTSQAIRNLQPLADGKVIITELLLSNSAPSVGKTLRSMHFPPNTLVVAILREGEVIIPNGETRLEATDKLSLVSLPESHTQIISTLVGKG
jgi:trk system potassium uptake protein TrkA